MLSEVNKACSRQTGISHLFADDTLLFFKANGYRQREWSLSLIHMLLLRGNCPSPRMEQSPNHVGIGLHGGSKPSPEPQLRLTLNVANTMLAISWLLMAGLSLEWLRGLVWGQMSSWLFVITMSNTKLHFVKKKKVIARRLRLFEHLFGAWLYSFRLVGERWELWLPIQTGNCTSKKYAYPPP